VILEKGYDDPGSFGYPRSRSSGVQETRHQHARSQISAALLEPYIRPAWLVPQFRHHVVSEHTDSPGDREGSQQVLRVTFAGIRDSVRVLLQVRMDSLRGNSMKQKT
jgi:hypothetical protein